ncbi:UNVERIFIED_CONTAM: hypothetical protein K2H54_040561 [Gekko kuhli]
MDVKRPYRTMMKLSKQYGPVFSIQLGFQKFVVLASYKTVKEALVNQADAFAGRPKVPMFEDFQHGNGIVLSNGENWKVMRRFAVTTLRDYGMGKKTIEDKIVEECQCLIQKFESFEGKPFETTTIMNTAVANIIVAILFGKRYEYEDPTFIRLVNVFSEMLQVFESPSVMLYNMFPALGFLSGGRKTILKHRDELYTFIEATFTEHLKELDVNDQRSFIDAFLIQQREEKNKNQSNKFFHNENLKAVVENLLGAGMETTSTTLRWGLLLMMKYPEIQKKVHEEITKVIGSTQPRIEHRAKLPYTDAVIHETQRFANILPMNLPHATTADVTLEDYFIPKPNLPSFCTLFSFLPAFELGSCANGAWDLKPGAVPGGNHSWSSSWHLPHWQLGPKPLPGFCTIAAGPGGVPSAPQCSGLQLPPVFPSARAWSSS